MIDLKEDEEERVIFLSLSPLYNNMQPKKMCSRAHLHLSVSLSSTRPQFKYLPPLCHLFFCGGDEREKKVHVIQHQVDIFSDCPFLSYSYSIYILSNFQFQHF